MSNRRSRLFLGKETLHNLSAQALARAAGGTDASYTTCPTVEGCETLLNCPSEIPCPDSIIGRKSMADGCTTR